VWSTSTSSEHTGLFPLLPFHSFVQIDSEIVEQHLHIYCFYFFLIRDVPARELIEFSWQVGSLHYAHNVFDENTSRPRVKLIRFFLEFSFSNDGSHLYNFLIYDFHVQATINDMYE
jgi:hypothetical protein